MSVTCSRNVEECPVGEVVHGDNTILTTVFVTKDLATYNPNSTDDSQDSAGPASIDASLNGGGCRLAL